MNAPTEVETKKNSQADEILEIAIRIDREIPYGGDGYKAAILDKIVNSNIKESVRDIENAIINDLIPFLRSEFIDLRLHR